MFFGRFHMTKNRETRLSRRTTHRQLNRAPYDTSGTLARIRHSPARPVRELGLCTCVLLFLHCLHTCLSKKSRPSNQPIGHPPNRPSFDKGGTRTTILRSPSRHVRELGLCTCVLLFLHRIRTCLSKMSKPSNLPNAHPQDKTSNNKA